MICIYKTNIDNNSHKEKLSKELDELIGSLKWNFDLEDCDRILRVETKRNISTEITKILKSNGFEVIELF